MLACRGRRAADWAGNALAQPFLAGSGSAGASPSRVTIPSHHTASPSRVTARPRAGLSLLEVLLALAILGGSLAAIGELMRIGARSAAASRDQTTAQILAETVMSQIGAGLIPPEAVTSAQVDDPLYQYEWSYSIVVEQIDQAGLIAVWVTVAQDPQVAARPASYSLARWMIDPEALLTETGF